MSDSKAGHTMTSPTKEVSKVIDAPIGEVWAIISAWGSERLWFPGVIKSSVEGFGIGSVRTLTFSDHSFSVSERLEVADPSTHTISYLILRDDDKMKKSRGTLSLTEVDDDGAKTRFTWTGRSEWIAPELKPQLEDMLDGMFNGAIDAVAKIVTK